MSKSAVFLLAILCLLSSGCGDDSTSDAGPDPSPEAATCADDAECDEGFCSGEGACVDESFECGCDDLCGEGRLCGEDSLCFDTPQAYRFLLIEDESLTVAGDLPGADIDTVSLIKGGSGVEIFAQTISPLSEVSCEGNLSCTQEAAIGSPDAIDPESGECFGGGDVDETLFLALNQGFIIVSFGDEVIENGDSIHVYEIGSVECGRFDDDPYSIAVSKSDGLDDFVEVGTGSDGSNTIPVFGLDDAPQSSRPCE